MATFKEIEDHLEIALNAIEHESLSIAEERVTAALAMVREINPSRCKKCGGPTEPWTVHLCSPNGGVNLPFSSPEAKALMRA